MTYLLLVTLLINHFYHWFCKGSCLLKIAFALSDEHASRAGNIWSRIILDVDVVGLIDKEYGLIGTITHASFGWWLSFSIWIRYYFCILIPLVWFPQLMIFFFKQFFMSYMFASDGDGWNLMRWWLLSVDSLYKWTA